MDSAFELLDRSPKTDVKSSPPLRVAILSYRSDPRVGGQGVYVDYLSRALLEAGAQVDVISGPPYPDLDARVKLIRLPSLDLFSKPYNGHFSLRPRHLLSATDTYEYFGHLSGKFVEPYTFGQRVFRYLKQHAHTYDVILDNQTLAEGTLAIQEKLGLPLVTMIHHPITQDRRLAIEKAEDWQHRLLARRWYSFVNMQRRVAKKLHYITCPSEHAKADISAEFGVNADQIQPIALGVDQTAFRPKPDIAKRPKRLITTASADTPLKGLHVLVEAYHQALQQDDDLELVVIGKLRRGLAKQTIHRLGLAGRVEFKSDLTREELADEFNRAHIAITPSLYEGFGLPAAEAMSCGTPVIVTDGGALPEVAGHAGIVVPKGDPQPLARAILDLVQNPEKHAEVAAACLARARDAFNWQKIAPHYLALLEKARVAAC